MYYILIESHVSNRPDKPIRFLAKYREYNFIIIMIVKSKTTFWLMKVILKIA